MKAALEEANCTLKLFFHSFTFSKNCAFRQIQYIKK